ncbi:MAG: hypothetical protein ACM3ZC_00480 [Bacteroidota bacterium]
MLAFIRIFLGNPVLQEMPEGAALPERPTTCYALLWQAGHDSVIRNVFIRRPGKGGGGAVADGPPKVFRGNGGGAPPLPGQR